MNRVEANASEASALIEDDGTLHNNTTKSLDASVTRNKNRSAVSEMHKNMTVLLLMKHEYLFPLQKYTEKASALFMNPSTRHSLGL